MFPSRKRRSVLSLELTCKDHCCSSRPGGHRHDALTRQDFVDVCTAKLSVKSKQDWAWKLFYVTKNDWSRERSSKRKELSKRRESETSEMPNFAFVATLSVRKEAPWDLIICLRDLLDMAITNKKSVLVFIQLFFLNVFVTFREDKNKITFFWEYLKISGRYDLLKPAFGIYEKLCVLTDVLKVIVVISRQVKFRNRYLRKTWFWCSLKYIRCSEK